MTRHAVTCQKVCCVCVNNNETHVKHYKGKILLHVTGYQWYDHQTWPKYILTPSPTCLELSNMLRTKLHVCKQQETPTAGLKCLFYFSLSTSDTLVDRFRLLWPNQCTHVFKYL